MGRRLLVIHQDRRTRRFAAVGVLQFKSDGRYEFTYLPGVRDAELLRSIPGRDRLVSESLPAFFTTRVMDPKQPGFDDWVQAYELTATISPIEILARGAGERMTDTYQVVEVLQLNEAGRAYGHFMVSGHRYVDDPRVADRLRSGQELDVVPERTNPKNPEALQLLADGQVVGWVPAWLVFTISVVWAAHGEAKVHVVRVNPLEAGVHLRVFASLEIQAPVGTRLYEWDV